MIETTPRANWVSIGPEFYTQAGSVQAVRDSLGRIGFLKPLRIRDECAYREVLVAEIAKRLGLRGFNVVAIADEPRVVSVRHGHLAFGLNAVLGYDQLEALALPYLTQYSGIVVLDALVGAADRNKCWHHVYSHDFSTWYSIDYGYSFSDGSEHTAYGAGDPEAQYKGDYPPAIVNSVKSFGDEIKRMADRAMGLSDLELIVDEVPHHIRPADRVVEGQYRRFLQRRRETLDKCLASWGKRNDVALE